jgi:hypothetical protein
MDSSGSASSLGLIVGVVVGGVACILATILIVVLVLRRRKSKKPEDLESKEDSKYQSVALNNVNLSGLLA